MTRIFAVAVLMLGASTAVMAGASTPEIDASTATAAVALLIGGSLVIRGRRKK